MANKLSNVSISLYRKFLTSMGCKHIRTNGGHEIWCKSSTDRPITFQTHIEPVPERIIKQCFPTLGIDKKIMLKKLSEL